MPALRGELDNESDDKYIENTVEAYGSKALPSEIRPNRSLKVRDCLIAIEPGLAKPDRALLYGAMNGNITPPN